MKKLLHQIHEVQDVLGLSRSNIYNLERRGELEMVKVGTRSLITDASLEAFVERLRAKSLEKKLSA